MIFKNKEGDAPAQIRAFDDTWTWTSESEMAYGILMDTKIGSVMSGLRDAVGTNDLMAYLVMMAIRLLELHRVLKSTGSIYLHYDPTASHYLKIMLDSIFGIENFLNEIIWCYTGPRKSPNTYSKKHDVILFYRKSNECYFIPPRIEHKSGVHNTGQVFGSSKQGDEKKKKNMESRGKLLEDWWVDIWATERYRSELLGYPTQKPLALLERIIKASSSGGHTILDPFCGCGTAVIAAEKLGRNWIGIDVTHLAVNLIEKRLQDSFGVKPQIIRVPQSLDAAQKLADTDKFQFELWAISLIPKLHSNEKQVGDRGIDGRGQIEVGLGDNNRPKYEKIIASVKGGNQTNPAMVRDLVGTVESEGAAFGIFICMKKPTKRMLEAAVKGGIYTTPLGRQYQRVQIYTIEDYFNGLTPDIPDLVDSMKGKKQKKQAKSTQTTL